MQFLKVLIFLIVLVAVIDAQKGGIKRPKPQSVPSSPGGRKTPQPRPAPKPQPQRPQEPEDDSGSAGNAIEENNGESGPESGPEPPAVVPQTSFSCEGKQYSNFGMYADEEVDCSVYHMCVEGRKESFLCGTGTMFNQEILSCDHAAKVKCADSSKYYSANEDLGKPGAEPSNQPSQPSQSGSKGGSVAPQPRPRVQQPSKTNQPRPSPAPRPAPRPQPRPQPRPAPKPFEDDASDNEEPDNEPETPNEPEERPAPQPVPQPKQRPSKTSPPKPRERPQPKKSPQPKKTPIVQSYIDNESEGNVRRAYRARY